MQYLGDTLGLGEGITLPVVKQTAMTSIHDEPLLMKTEQAAKMLNVSASFLEKDRVHCRYGIPFVKIGRSVMYAKKDIEQYIQNNYACEPVPF